MTGPVGETEARSEPSEPSEPVSRRRTVLSVLVVLAAVGGAIAAAIDERKSFVDAYRHLGAGALVGSLVCGAVGTAGTFLAWDQVLRGYGVVVPRSEGFRVFFLSQLGKYLPGLVWPAVMQMEAGRRYGASRRTMLGANLTAIVLGCSTGLIVACAVVPWYAPHALSRYWWLLLAVPLLLALLHPRALPALLDVPFRLLKRPPVGDRLEPRREAAAGGWSLVNWAAFGTSLGILAHGVAPHRSVATVVFLSIGAMAMATTAGILFIPAPAGAGVREVVLVLVLSSVMTTGSALAVAIASRVVLMVCDLAFAGCAALLLRFRRP